MTKREAKQAPMTLPTFVRVGRPWSYPPKGWAEKPGGVHMGAGIWMLRYERADEQEEK
jgi:hypothetical protein